MRRQVIRCRRPRVYALRFTMVAGKRMIIAPSVGASLGFPVQWVWKVSIGGLPAHEHASWDEAVECALAHAETAGAEPPC